MVPTNSHVGHTKRGFTTDTAIDTVKQHMLGYEYDSDSDTLSEVMYQKEYMIEIESDIDSDTPMPIDLAEKEN